MKKIDSLIKGNSLSEAENDSRSESPNEQREYFIESESFRIEDLEPVELLRQRLNEWAFQRANRDKDISFYRTDRILRLGTEHGAEKRMRYNYLCPYHHVVEKIKEQKPDTAECMPLCIDKCEECPNVKYNLENNDNWIHIAHKHVEGVSTLLNSFISEEVPRGKKNVTKNTTLKLHIQLLNIATQEQLCYLKDWTIKVLKKLWFEKIRTSTPAKPGDSQPLNLTYGRFWMEVIPEKVYLNVIALNTSKRIHRTPIDSVIGANIGSTMQMCLALQSFFRNSKTKFGTPKDVAFELYIKKGLISSEGLRVNIALTKVRNRQPTGQAAANDIKEIDVVHNVTPTFEMFSFDLISGTLSNRGLPSFHVVAVKPTLCQDTQDQIQKGNENDQRIQGAKHRIKLSNNAGFCPKRPKFDDTHKLKKGSDLGFPFTKKTLSRPMMSTEEIPKEVEIPSYSNATTTININTKIPIKTESNHVDLLSFPFPSNISNVSPSLSLNERSKYSHLQTTFVKQVTEYDRDKIGYEKNTEMLNCKRTWNIVENKQKEINLRSGEHDPVKKSQIEKRSNNVCNYLKNENEDIIKKIPPKQISESTMTMNEFSPAIIGDNYPPEIKEILENINEEEKELGQHYEDLLQHVQKKVAQKRWIKEQAQQWDLFLSRWKEWKIQEIHSYLTQIKNRQYAKYFPSAKEMQMQWYNEHGCELEGSHLYKIDREDLHTLGVTDKDDRKSLIDLIHNLCETKK